MSHGQIPAELWDLMPKVERTKQCLEVKPSSSMWTCRLVSLVWESGLVPRIRSVFLQIPQTRLSRTIHSVTIFYLYFTYILLIFYYIEIW